jgi:uncharacterized protein
LKALKPFNIAFVGLSTGEHEFTFDLNDDFFACFDASQITKARLKGTLIMLKKPNMLDLQIKIEGQVWVECDRCLEPFWYQLDSQNDLFIKFGERKEEQSDDVIIIPTTDSHIDVSQFFYEFAMLGLPARIVHEESPGEKQQCDPLILEQLEKYKPKNLDSSNEKNNDKPTDSRWDALKNFKFN